MPSILFLHTNFPAQFGFIGQRLAADGWDVTFATGREGARSPDMKILPFAQGREPSRETHSYLTSTERAVIKGQEAARVLLPAKKQGLDPDIVMAHSGWGTGLFLRDIFPKAINIPYLEWWYRWPLIDVDFLGELTESWDVRLRQRIRNAPMMLDLSTADFCLAPTEFQASQFPDRVREMIRVMHDGVDTGLCAPAGSARREVAGLDLWGYPELVTYATRGMEPQRGFPQFMRALALLQARRPKLHAVIVGEDRVAYGKKLPEGDSWKKRMLAELDLDLSRVHFTGQLPRRDYHAVLQASQAHVYLTVPFVLSWSMLEAMSTACPMVVSDTDPVREFIRHGEQGLMVDFHDPSAIASGIERLLEDKAEAARLGAAARETILADYDLDVIFERKKALFLSALDASG